VIAEPGTPDERRAERQRDTTEQVFVVSAAMVGVCLTLMGIVGIITSLSQFQTLADEMLASDAIVFLVACLASYLALRREPTSARRFERTADIAFIVGLIAIVFIGGVFVFRLI
jgi:purine-cytosine permease-like protein